MPRHENKMKGFDEKMIAKAMMVGGGIEDPLVKGSYGMSTDPIKKKANMGMNDRVMVNTPQYKGAAPGMRMASKGLEALAKANPELTYKKARRGYEY